MKLTSYEKEPRTYTASTKSAVKDKCGEAYAASVLLTADEYQPAKEAARRWLIENRSRRVAFVQTWRREANGLRLLKEYTITRRPLEEGDGTAESEALALERLHKKEQAERIRREAARISQEQGRPYAEVARELRQKAKAEEDEEKRRQMAEIRKAKAEQWRKENAALLEAQRQAAKEARRKLREENRAKQAEKKARKAAKRKAAKEGKGAA